MSGFTRTETTVLHRIQKDIDITERPFEVLARDCGIDEDLVIATIRSLKERDVIRNIAAIFNANRLGYRSALVAFRVAPDGVERAAAIINGHPGVSHNYLREHAFNLWFTLTAESEQELDRAAAILASLSGADDFMVMRNRRLFKIGVDLDVSGGEDDGAEAPSNYATSHSDPSSPAITLGSDEKEAVRLLQFDLPLTERPFRAIIEREQSFLPEEALVRIARELKRAGVMRRYSCVLRHRNAGYTINAMTAWKPAPGADIERIAAIFAGERTVSHLYLRDTFPGRWEHPLFAMIHARGRGELDATIQRLSRDSGMTGYLSLESTREFKKERVRYCSPKFEEWKKAHD